MENKDIYKEREKYRQRTFYMMLEISAIIALPAFVALFLGKYLDGKNQNNFYVYILLILAFIISWALIIRKYIIFSKKIKEVDKKIKEIKNDNGYNSNNRDKTNN